MDLETWLSLPAVTAAVKLAQAAFERLRTKDEQTKEQWKTAVLALQTAVLQTQVYVAHIGRGNQRDGGREEALTNAWGAAAGHFYGLDKNLSDRLSLKGTYWTKPEAWTDDQVIDAGISLQQVSEVMRQFLREGDNPRRITTA